VNFTALSSVKKWRIVENGLTWPLLLDLFSYHCKGGKQFRHYSDDNFVHSSCRRDFGINVQVGQEFIDGLEQVYERIIARIDALDRLNILSISQRYA